MVIASRQGPQRPPLPGSGSQWQRHNPERELQDATRQAGPDTIAARWGDLSHSLDITAKPGTSATTIAAGNLEIRCVKTIPCLRPAPKKKAC